MGQIKPEAISPAASSASGGDLFQYQGKTYPLFPARLAVCPNLPSPLPVPDGKEVSVHWRDTRGWQESLFADEILGMYEFEVWREMDIAEKAFLEARYAHLGALEKAA